MNKQLSFSHNVVIGTMLFGLFFGAGNLIFPLFLGQLSGTQVWPAIFGFLVSGIGLPFLGVLAMGYANGKNVQQLAAKVHPVYGVIFTLALYFIIGPFAALPRTGTVSYEIGISSFVSKDNQTLGLAIYTFIYFALTLYFSLNPAKILMWVGKILTPVFLIFILIIIALAIFFPMGQFNQPIAPYIDNPFAQGIIEGYNTMDALASLAFGIIVVNAVKQYGINQPKSIVLVTAKSGFIGMALMGLLYIAIAYVGASSVDTIGRLENGGVILANVVYHYVGSYVGIFLAVLIFFTCITTAIGLVSACATCFHHYLPKVSYKTFVVIVSIVAALVANIGLTNLIKFAVPVLMMICPLTLALIMLIFITKKRIVYVMTIAFTTLACCFDSVNSAISVFEVNHIPAMLTNLLELHKYLPLSSVGFGWLIPMFVGLALGELVSLFTRKK